MHVRRVHIPDQASRCGTIPDKLRYSRRIPVACWASWRRQCERSEAHRQGFLERRRDGWANGVALVILGSRGRPHVAAVCELVETSASDTAPTVAPGARARVASRAGETLPVRFQIPHEGEPRTRADTALRAGARRRSRRVSGATRHKTGPSRHPFCFPAFKYRTSEDRERARLTAPRAGARRRARRGVPRPRRANTTAPQIANPPTTETKP